MSTSIAPAMARRIEIWPTERLVPYAKNARTHSPEQVAQIAASIAEFGFNAPILVDSNAGIIAGHGRLLAARKLGLAEVPVVVLDHLSETQRRAYVIADNKLALNAGWDEKVLAAELHDLEQDGVDLALVGFSDDELEDLLAGDEPQSSPDVEEEAVPEEPANPVTRPGDLWAIGPHRLICGDCRDLATVQTLLDGSKANVCITSPPYATQREYDSTSGFKPVPPDEYVAWYKDVVANIGSVLAEDGSYFLNIKEHADEGERNLYVKDLVIAHRRAWAYRHQYEPIVYGWREGGTHYWCGDRNQGDTWMINRPAANREHPTMKPVELVERALRNNSKSRDTILDPFGGSGTTIIACEKTGRQARVIELDPKYCDVIIRRWQAFTGQEARHEESGRAFDEVAAGAAEAPGEPPELREPPGAPGGVMAGAVT